MLISIPTAAHRLDLCVKSVRRLIASGELPTVKIGRSIRIPSAALEQFVERKTTWRSGVKVSNGSSSSCSRGTVFLSAFPRSQPKPTLLTTKPRSNVKFLTKPSFTNNPS